MKTDWTNYRQLRAGEIIQNGDQQLSPESEGEWDEIDACRIGKPARDPLCHGHMKYRRRISRAAGIETASIGIVERAGEDEMMMGGTL
jgi:hypothetical protein